MATVTPNFNWPVPTSTDLVKDGATAIEALGDSIDASLVDLKGGTTGQVLSKTSGTDMDFTWVTTDDANAIQNSIVDAKGDLISATGNDTPARLAVGNNGESLVADSSTSTGLRYQSGYNGNAFINGGFDIWQRGTSIASTASPVTGTYTADRFRINQNTGRTVSRQASSLTGIQYCARVQRDSGNTGTGGINLGSDLESADSYRFAGQTVTFSFYARAGANYSSAASALTIAVVTGTGTDQNSFSGFTGQSTIIGQTATLTTSWQRFTYTAAVGSNATQIGAQFSYTPVGTAGAADYFELTGVQLELGSVATQFKRSNGSGGTIQGELSAAQRYYYRTSGATTYGFAGTGTANTTSQAYISVNLPVTMRTAPASVDFSAQNLNDTATNNAVTSVTLSSAFKSADIGVIEANVAGTPLTVFRTVFLTNNNNAAGYIGFSAEL
jgi:hypothetical protein